MRGEDNGESQRERGDDLWMLSILFKGNLFQIVVLRQHGCDTMSMCVWHNNACATVKRDTSKGLCLVFFSEGFFSHVLNHPISRISGGENPQSKIIHRNFGLSYSHINHEEQTDDQTNLEP